MQEQELERVMLEFLRGDQDVLVSTTIIESGLDIPNANTLVVERADLLGLAQLYQIRGRIGRSARVAHAFLFHPDRLARIPGLAAVADRFRDFHAMRWHSDPSRAREELGWTAATPLEQGLRRTWEWYRANRWA